MGSQALMRDTEGVRPTEISSARSGEDDRRPQRAVNMTTIPASAEGNVHPFNLKYWAKTLSAAMRDSVPRAHCLRTFESDGAAETTAFDSSYEKEKK
jgi:hypothetical protein